MMIEITDIQRLEVRPGQALIVRVPGNISLSERDRVIAAFRFALPGTPVFVVRDDVQFSVQTMGKVHPAGEEGTNDGQSSD